MGGFRQLLRPLVLLILISVASDSNAQQTFKIDNVHSSLVFSVSHYKIGYIFGRFNRCSGTATIDSFEPYNSKFSFRIEADSIDTNNVARDASLKGSEYFDAQQHPAITFVSDTVTEQDGVYTATGKMKIRDLERDVTIPLQLLGVGKGAGGRTRIGMLGKFKVMRSEFGMITDLDTIGNDIAITFSFQGTLEQ